MTTIEQKSLRVGKYVSTQHVDTVIRNYKQERWVHNSERLGKEDSLSAWWSIEEIEEFLERAKMHGGDGIKFYFGAYDKNYTENPDYAGRQTLAMVATKQKLNEEGEASNKDIYIPTANGNNILAYNAANLCPPYCGPKPKGINDNELGITLIDSGDKGLIIV